MTSVQKNTCDQNPTMYALMKTRNGQVLYNLNTNKKSDKHVSFYIYGGIIVYHDDKKCGILNSDFKVLNEFDSGYLALHKKHYLSETHPLIYTSSKTKIVNHDFRPQDSLIYHIDKKIEPYKGNGENRKKPLPTQKRAIFNYYTGKSTPFYTSISRNTERETMVFWGLNYPSDRRARMDHNWTRDTVDLHIYNKNLDHIKSFRFLDDYVFSKAYNTSFIRGTDGVFAVLDTNNLFGTINAFGETTIDFKYDGHYVIYPKEKNDRTAYYRNIMHVFQKDGKSCVYNKLGEEFLPLKYDTIRLINSTDIIATVGDTSFRYYFKHNVPRDTILNYSYDDHVEPSYFGPRKRPLNYYYWDDSRYPAPKSYDVEDDHLFFKDEDTTILIDTNLRKSPYELTSVNNDYIVNRSGKVIYKGRHILESQGKSHFLYVDKTISIIDNDGAVLEKFKKGRVIKNDGNLSIVIPLHRKYGLYDTDAQNWAIGLSAYKQLIWDVAANTKDQYLWARTKKEKEYVPVWQIIDTTGQPAYSYTFNKHEAYSHGITAMHIVQSGLKMGALKTNLQLIVPPIYDHLISVDSSFLFIQRRKLATPVRTKQT